MLPESVENDSDLPELLNSISKQEKRARTLAAAHLGKKARSVLAPKVQGYFSRTRIVTMVGGDKIVIQFRIQPLDIQCFKKARQLFGAVVPEITQLHDQEIGDLGMFVFAMSYVPGCLWVSIRSSDIAQRARIAEDLGTILGRGLVSEQSAAVVDDSILPRLERFRASINEATELLRPQAESLIAAVPNLKRLPLYMSHYDLNEMNVLIAEDQTISGIVDWECAQDLPFGMGLHRITDTIVAQNCKGEIEIPESSKEAEQAFWNAVLRDAPRTVLENLEHVQTALRVGILLFAYEEKFLQHPRNVPLTARFLTYRLPQLRGDEDPFAL